MRVDEFSLYERLEKYITDFYQKYENERRGLGFVMTVYRRRLTSSFYSVRCSLERRLKFLKGELAADEVLSDDDFEQEDLSLDISEDMLTDPASANGSIKQRFAMEIAYVRDFIQELKLLGPTDSKLEWLTDELNQVFKARSKVIVFTQYTDTMDYLREQLSEVYGAEVACYSGRGGEVWNGIAWAQTTKEKVKAEFKDGSICILLCTDSASEGLNLQMCGALINYDMPWNPMRVEQRIGRIDRIGQQYEHVWISNYFYQDTIEDLIYQRLADRIDWFEVVVGDLQPILAEVGETTRRLAMLPAEQREIELEKEIDALKQRLQNREMEALNLDDFASVEDTVSTAQSPVTLIDLEEILTHSGHIGALFQPHTEIPEAYRLRWRDEVSAVTFSARCFDLHPETVQFLSYGNPILDELLASAPNPDWLDQAGVMRFTRDADGMEFRGWYTTDGEAKYRLVQNIAELQQWLDSRDEKRPLQVDHAQEAGQEFQNEVEAYQRQYAEAIRRRRAAQLLAEKVRARRLLVKAALVEIALGQQKTLFDTESYPSAFSESAIRGLQRHGYPWGALLKLVYEDGMFLSEEDEYFKQIQGSHRDSLKGRFIQLGEDAKRMVTVIINSRPLPPALRRDE